MCVTQFSVLSFSIHLAQRSVRQSEDLKDTVTHVLQFSWPASSELRWTELERENVPDPDLVKGFLARAIRFTLSQPPIYSPLFYK